MLGNMFWYRSLFQNINAEKWQKTVGRYVDIFTLILYEAGACPTFCSLVDSRFLWGWHRFYSCLGGSCELRCAGWLQGCIPCLFWNGHVLPAVLSAHDQSKEQPGPSSCAAQWVSRCSSPSCTSCLHSHFTGVLPAFAHILITIANLKDSPLPYVFKKLDLL